jgi:type IV fimbrial biogenesis protein FimT
VTFSAASGCVTTNDSEPWQGWAVFVDDDTSGNINGTERVVRVQAISGNGLNLISDAALAGAGNRIAFRPDGLARGMVRSRCKPRRCACATHPARWKATI